MKTTFQRKLSVEFVDNYDVIKAKTSKSKKTLRSLINFMSERHKIELNYSQSLQNLAKSGNIIQFTRKSNIKILGGVSISHSIIEFKNYEEPSMRDALNSIINFTIQESELHKDFATQMKQNVVGILDETRKTLSVNKRLWMNKLEQLKKQIKDANEVYRREHTKYLQAVTIAEDLKKKRDEQYKKFGLEINDKLSFDNMPKPIQMAEQKYQEAVYRFNEIKKQTTIQQEYNEKCVTEFNKGSSDILDSIEANELKRMEIIKQSLNSFSVVVANLGSQFESLHKLIDMEFTNIDPMKDLQSFISRYSSLPENERLRNMYKEMGLYNPINEESGPRLNGIIGNALIEKTSKAMAIQLKQLEEDRKKKILEDEITKKQNEQLQVSQSIVNQFKNIRDINIKMGDQIFENGKIDVLYMPRSKVSSYFSIGQKSTLDQIIYLLLIVKKPIQVTQYHNKRFGISKEVINFIEPLASALFKQKIENDDLFEVLEHILDFYKNMEHQEKKFFEVKASQKEKEFYKSVLGLCWYWIRLIIFRHSTYIADAYDKELAKFIDIVELEHHQANQTSSECIDFTLNAMKYCKKIAKKESFALAYPLNYMMHQQLTSLYFYSREHDLKNEYHDQKDKESSNNSQNGEYKADEFKIMNEDFILQFDKLTQFSSKYLGVKSGFQIFHLIKLIYNNYLKNEANFIHQNEKQNAALYAIKSLLMVMNRQYLNVIKMKLISVEMVRDQGIVEPLDFFNNQNSQKMLFRLNNSWILNDIQKDLFKFFERYEENFGTCINKLRLLLDLASVAYKINYVFTSDGSFQSKLKSEILVKAGEKITTQLIQVKKFQKPYTLIRRDDPNGRTCILDVITSFNEKLYTEQQAYRKVWEYHLKGIDKRAETPLYHYAQLMNDIIEEDLVQKLDELDFDKDPNQIVGDLIESLQKFDSLTGRKTLHVVKPKLEQWLQVKILGIKEVVIRCINFETWQPVTDKYLNSESVVNVFYTLNETLESLYDFIGQEIFVRWSKCIQVMIHDVIFEYCEFLLKGLDNASQFRPPENLPPILLQQRKKQKKSNVVERVAQVVYTASSFTLLSCMGSKNYESQNDQKESLEKLLLRLANLDFIIEQLDHLKIRFFVHFNNQGQQLIPKQLFKSTYEIINDTAKTIIRYIANKMVYVDFQDVIFANLYIGQGSEMISIKSQISQLNNYMKKINRKSPQKYFKEILSVLNICLTEALLRYLMLITSLGHQISLNIEDFFKNPAILEQDIKELIQFFTPKDRDVRLGSHFNNFKQGNLVGLNRAECEQNAEVLFRFLQYMKESDQVLIQAFKGVDNDVQRNKEMLSRILYRRSSKEVDKFFEDYKTLFGGK